MLYYGGGGGGQFRFQTVEVQFQKPKRLKSELSEFQTPSVPISAWFGFRQFGFQTFTVDEKKLIDEQV